MLITLIVTSTLLAISCCSERLVFPPGFKFGAATSAYQVEGAWNVSDKGISIWDHMLHSTNLGNADGSNGDVASDSYHQWRRDVEIAEELGLNHYRFSISWPRLLPDGFANKISEDGKNYYNNLINALLERGIEPMVTIYHWDLPQNLQDLGGWVNPHVTDWFADYARIVYSLFADRVTSWVSINEPVCVCDLAYNVGLFAPRLTNNVSIYACNKNVLMAHAKAWRIYDEEYKPKYNGKVSICNLWIWYEAESDGDEEAAELALQYMAGRYSHPIYSEEGGWPPSIEKFINEYASKLGYTQPWLPAFTPEEIEFVKGTYDYSAFNFYTSRTARKARPGEEVDRYVFIKGIPELGIVLESRPEWPQSFASNIIIHPEGMRKHLAWAKEKYGDIEFIIKENGLPNPGTMDDEDRIEFIYNHLRQVWLAIFEDGTNVTAYTYWSMMDSFEWTDYSSKFGLYHVDYNSPKRVRTPRASAHYYKRLIETSSLHLPTQSDLKDYTNK